MDEQAQKDFILGRSKGLGFNHIFVVNMDGVGYYIDEGVHREQGGEEFFYNIKHNDIFIAEPFTQERARLSCQHLSPYMMNKGKK